MPLLYSTDSGSCGRSSSSNSLQKQQKQKHHVVRYFVHRHLRYLWNAKAQTFALDTGLVGCARIGEILACNAIAQHGTNSIDVEVKSYLRLFVDEVLSPFYIFQALAIALWCADDYYYYAICILVVSGVSLVVETVETRRNMEALRAMVAGHDVVRLVDNAGCAASCVTATPATPAAVAAAVASRDDYTTTAATFSSDSHFISSTTMVSSVDLVPGDVFEVSPGMQVPVDAVIVSGACLVNESMLTGESLLVNKTEVSAEASNEILQTSADHKPHTLFRGTEVVQNRSTVVLAVV
eukprot:UC1_evm1s361